MSLIPSEQPKPIQPNQTNYNFAKQPSAALGGSDGESGDTTPPEPWNNGRETPGSPDSSGGQQPGTAGNSDNNLVPPNKPEAARAGDDGDNFSDAFKAIEDFNKAEVPTRRVIEFMIEKAGQTWDMNDASDELYQLGATDQEVAEQRKLAEEQKTPAESNIEYDHAALKLRFEEAFKELGLKVGDDLTREVHLLVQDGQKLASRLSNIPVENCTEAIKQGTKSMIDFFVQQLPQDIMHANSGDERITQEQADKATTLQYLDYQTIIQTLQFGDSIAEQAERLGVESDSVKKLQRASECYKEGTMLEWALMEDLGFYGNPHYPDANDATYRLLYPEEMPSILECLKTATAKTGVEGKFVTDFVDQAKIHLGAYLRALVHEQRSLTPHAEARLWPDPFQAELRIAQEAQNEPFIEEILQLRAAIEKFRPLHKA